MTGKRGTPFGSFAVLILIGNLILVGSFSFLMGFSVEEKPVVKYLLTVHKFLHRETSRLCSLFRMQLLGSAEEA